MMITQPLYHRWPRTTMGRRRDEKYVDEGERTVKRVVEIERTMVAKPSLPIITPVDIFAVKTNSILVNTHIM